MLRNDWLPEVFSDFFDLNMPRVNATAPAINVMEGKEGYTVELAAPGLNKDDFDVSLNNDGDLRIKMENHHTEESTREHYLRREFSFGKYEQTLVLPDDVDKTKIKASVADGVLTVDLPKLNAEKPTVSRQIRID